MSNNSYILEIVKGAALENLSAGRVAIMQESFNALASAVIIAVRYAALRKQFSDISGQELSLLSYQLHVSNLTSTSAVNPSNEQGKG